jgi:hypothetical protein
MSGTHASSPTRRYGAQAVNTSGTDTANELHGGATHTVTINTPVADATLLVVAPCTGKLESVTVASVEAATTAEVKALSIQSCLGTTTAEVAAMQTLALAAMTPGEVTLSTTATTKNMTQGELLKITWDVDSITTNSLGVLTCKFIEGITHI